MSDIEDQRKNNYVFGYDASNIPLWVWAIVLGLLFILFVMGIYYGSKGSNIYPQISSEQYNLTRGILNTPGAL